MRYGITTKDEPIVCPVDEVGNFTNEVPDFAGVNVKVREGQPAVVAVALTECDVVCVCACLH
jgi:isoleucyl-tRNA synthetase